MSKPNTVTVGIMAKEAIRERMMAIARGEYKPASDEPKIWFTSIRSAAEVLSDDNRAMLRAIRDQQPESISALSRITGRSQSNLSRTLNTLHRYGIVEFRRENRHKRPIAKASDFVIRAN